MYISLFAGSFFLAFSGAMMPGPLLTATIGAAAQRGPSAGPLFIVGHGILELGLVALIILGIGPFLTGIWTFITISLTGSCIMLYMAYSMFRSLPSLSLTQNPEHHDYGSLVGTGALLSVSNPYWTVWWGTIGLGLLLRAQNAGILGIASFFGGHILGDLVWYTAVSLAIWRGKRLLSDRMYRGLIALCGGVIAAFGIYFFISGIKPIMEVVFL
ncbi:LysE family transporter [Marispirochaeta sp.]|uniref:LysE family translocator n=1 Tax=Marispirochaeta sp. TaxID=2038653 RepID=UPI0029C729F8|nr:LysE family transporter [Marispirochaeta sp.]